MLRAIWLICIFTTIMNAKRILVCPLDWGLGHATRCIPIIEQLVDEGREVIIAASGRPALLLKQAFPNLQHIAFAGYDISYPKNGNMAWWALMNAPRLLKKIQQEHLELLEIVKTQRIDAILSDNRYGLWHPTIKSIFITHQLHIACPPWLFWLKPFLRAMNISLLRRFHAVWVPDHHPEKAKPLAGALSAPLKEIKNLHYIGPLSRLIKQPEPAVKSYDLLVLLSGPEPQRSLFEEKIRSQLKDTKLRVLLVRGMPEAGTHIETTETIHSAGHLRTQQLQGAIAAAKIVLARSGYSTVMDLAKLKAKAIFVPTPGQTEQEYLAAYLQHQKISYSESQHQFNLMRCINNAAKFSGFQLAFVESDINSLL